MQAFERGDSVPDAGSRLLGVKGKSKDNAEKLRALRKSRVEAPKNTGPSAAVKYAGSRTRVLLMIT